MIKSALAFFTTLLIAGGAIAQNPPSNAAPQFNTSKNVWAGDNFEQVCTITATGSPGTFTPTCPSNNITITASGQTIALPRVGTPPGYQPSQVTKSVELNIFYAAPYVPTFASGGYGWVNSTAPALCSAGASGCLSGVVSGNPDIIECRTINETLVRCGNVLTAVGPPTGPSVLSANTSTRSAGSGVSSQSVSLNLTAGSTLIVGAGNDDGSNGQQVSSIAGTGVGTCTAFTNTNDYSAGRDYIGSLYHCAVNTTGSNVSVTVNYSSPTGNVTVSAMDVANLNSSPDDGIGNFVDNQTSNNSFSINGTGSTSQSSELIVMSLQLAGGTSTISAGSGYTMVGTPTSTFAMEYKIQSSTGTPTASMSTSSNVTFLQFNIAAAKHS